MILIEDIDKIRKPYINGVVSIGNFDGMHLGHRALFGDVIKKAKSIGGTSIAMTFEPHPIRLLKSSGHPSIITISEQKFELMADTGIDVLICIPFTKQFASISARQFVEDILVKRMGMKVIVIGKDYSFGKNREGNLEFLQKCSNKLGFEVIVIDWVYLSSGMSERISSTKIRELVTAGHITKAKEMLGRNYQIRGTVVKGRNRGGELLGFPTANINLDDELCPKTGVYAVTVEYQNEKFCGVANIGYSPTFDDHIYTVEAHILDFNSDLYGKKIRVNFVKRIRDEIKFESIEKLAEQISNDVKTARNVLALETNCDHS